MDPHRGDGGHDFRECRIAVVQQLPRRLFFGKGVAELLSRPCGCGMVGHSDVDDPSPVMRKDDLRGTHAQRLHAGNAGGSLQAFKGLETTTCRFANLPESKSGRWGAGLTAKKMADCRWLKPVLVGQFESLEWTGDHHLRHWKFVALREDKGATAVMRE